MDELERLKKDWKAREGTLPRLTYNQIYEMLWKRSSSVVKWIFIISIIEFVFWTALSLFMKDSGDMQRIKSYHAENIIIPLTVAGYAVLFYFMYRFFVNYRKISVTDNARTLMENILRTRRSVKRYVWFNIIYFIIISIVVAVLQLNYDEKIAGIIREKSLEGSTLYFYAAFIGVVILMVTVVSVLLWMFYRLIYGFLLRKLRKNYNELRQIEV